MELTGFNSEALWSTGLVERYRTVAIEQLGPARFERLLQEAGQPRGRRNVQGDWDDWDDGLLDAARAVTQLWYTGSWPGPPPFVVSPHAYARGLAWTAAGLAAPATAPAGYGSWGHAPAGESAS
ncbi:hypothetical protein [Streptomyces boluensis]|nr:hypothetical protein [Streptomyces boluensis]